MKFTLLVVGKTTDSRVQSLIDEYINRIKHYITFDIQVIPDLKNTKSLSISQQKVAEGELILRALPTNAALILLDEHGTMYRSVEYAAYLQKRMTAGRDIVFVIGGAYGFSDAVYARAESKLSLSPMTFSHQMIRILFVEQVYRALTILRSEPYHHE